MSGIRVTIDDIEVPVIDSDRPRYSFSLLDLEDPDRIKGSESTTFRMPATREVRNALGGPGMSERLINPRPRVRVGNGGQVLYESNAVPAEMSSDEYSVIAVGDNAEWFDLAKNQRLRAMDMGVSEEINDTLVRDSWTDEDLAIRFPGIDFGSFEDRAASYNVTVAKMRPAAVVHTFISHAFAQWGFSLRPMGSLGSFWKKLVMPNVDGDIPVGSDYTYHASASFSNVGTQGFSITGTDHNVAFNNVIYDPSSTYVAPGRYAAPFDQQASVNFTYDMTAVVNSGFNPGVMTVRFELYNFTAGQSVATQQFQMSTFLPTLSGTIDFGSVQMFSGQQFGVRVRLTSSATTHSLTLNYTDIYFGVQSITYQEGVTVDIAKQAPDMTVMDVLKAVAGNRCLIFKTNSAHGEVQMWYDTEFYRSTEEGIDWTTRIDHTNRPVKQIPLYPVRIEYRWATDDNDADLQDLRNTVDAPGYGNYDKEMEGGTKDPMRIEVEFAATAMDYLFDGNVFWPVMREEGGTYQTDSYKRKPRLLIMDGLHEGEWTFDGVTETHYPMCYFIHREGRYTLAFGSGAVYGDAKLGTAQLQWAERQRRMMSPALKADVRIYPDEVWDIDMGIPRLIHDGFDPVWMYLQKIDQYDFGGELSTECTLIPM